MPCSKATLHNVSRGLLSAKLLLPLIGRKTGIHLARSIYILSHSITVATSHALTSISLLLMVGIHAMLGSSSAWRAEATDTTSFSDTMAKWYLVIARDQATEPLGYLT